MTAAQLSFLCALALAALPGFAQDGVVRLRGSQLLAMNAAVPDAPAPVAEGASVGSVKTVTGKAFVVVDGKARAANVGTGVPKGAVLKTAADSSLGITFKDGTMMSFGPETELRVDEYLYAPAEGKLQFGSRLVRGTMNYVSGVIAKLKPDAVTVNTPTGMIGVRGTHFVAKVLPEAP
jgi:hypothetical protein